MLKITLYWDKYEVSNDEKILGRNLVDSTAENYTYNGTEYVTNQLRKNLAEARLNLMQTTKGDGMYEAILNEYSYSGRLNKTGNYNWMFTIDSSTAQYKACIYNKNFVIISNILNSFLNRGGFYVHTRWSIWII